MSKIEVWIWRFLYPVIAVGMVYAIYWTYARWGWFFGTLGIIAQLAMGMFMVPFIDALLPPIDHEKNTGKRSFFDTFFDSLMDQIDRWWTLVTKRAPPWTAGLGHASEEDHPIIRKDGPTGAAPSPGSPAERSGPR